MMSMLRQGVYLSDVRGVAGRRRYPSSCWLCPCLERRWRHKSVRRGRREGRNRGGNGEEREKEKIDKGEERERREEGEKMKR